MSRCAWFTFAAFALVALAAPVAIAEDVLVACAQSDAVAPLGIPEGQQDADTGRVLPGGAALPSAHATVSEGKKGLNAVNVKLA